MMSISFVEDANKKDGGSVALSTIINVNQPVNNGAVGFDAAYEVNVAATASLGGTWILRKTLMTTLYFLLTLTLLK